MVYTSTLIKEKILLLQSNVPPMNFRTAAKVKIYFYNVAMPTMK